MSGEQGTETALASPVGLLGDAAEAAAAAAAAKASELATSANPGASGNPGTPSSDGAPNADPGSRDTKTPEQLAAEKATAITEAEKAVTDAKTPEEKAAAEAKLAELKGGEKAGAPEKYEAFQMPEGVTLDEAALAAAEPLFRELNLSQTQAQKLVDFQAARVKEAAANQVEAWNTLLDARLAEAKADKDIGGTKWDESVGHAKTFIAQFGTPALQAYLNQSDAGSHVEIVRAFAKAGKALADDKFIPGGGGAASGGEKDLADRLFPNHPK